MATALAVLYREQVDWQHHQSDGPMASGPGDVVINMSNIPSAIDNRSHTTLLKDKKHEALFGPNIGIVSSGPQWAEGNEKKILNDQLTPDVVNGWIAKSKEANHPTTTLQALVNLKRPTLRLSPLSPETSEDVDQEAQHLHGLEFEYDCDAPKCGIYVHVLLYPDHPEAEQAVPAAGGLFKSLAFEQVVDGGFGKVLKFEEGAVLELGKLERKPVKGTDEAVSTPVDANPVVESTPPTNAEESRRKRRFTGFNFRKRIQGRAVTGPALAVVDAQPATDATPVAGSSKITSKAQDGVKVVIRLAALDQQGNELGSTNEQTTYLHVVRFGAKADGDADAEDTRPWVVKVVKREATIGLHTFHLHEIYGLSGASSSCAPSTSPLPSEPVHSYPPTASATTEIGTASECLVCLSSPREVVLLPCRHLVACRDCALNMVEFGAGGSITQPEAELPATTTTPVPVPVPAPVGDAPAVVDENAAGATTEGTTAVPPPADPPTLFPPPPAPAPRRKRRAKGWFCPVCRQPYTSLLRLTTNPPESPSKEETSAEAATSVEPAAPTTSGTSAGRLPSFLRSLSGRAATSGQNDIERNAGSA